MKYTSTRGYGLGENEAPASFTEVMLRGLASDGGLYVPESYPTLATSALDFWRGRWYADIAFQIFQKFVGDIPAKELDRICQEVYSPNSFYYSRNDESDTDITPLVRIYPDIDLYLGELGNGMTLSFKDIALQFVGAATEYVLDTLERKFIVLAATSGDTGSATISAFGSREGIEVFVLYPTGRVSKFQEDQMVTVSDPDVHVIAIDGDFDDAQRIAKTLFRDSDFKSRYLLGSANSINWARIMAQIPYYFQLYFAASANNESEVDFAVPTGNFGDILAGYIARRMGLPIRRLYLASNENATLPVFFKTGRYEPKETIVTSSPAMDISDPSNFEQFLFEMTGRDSKRIRELMSLKGSRGYFDVSSSGIMDAVRQSGIIADSVSHRERIEITRSVYADTGIMLDPHTANAAYCGCKHFCSEEDVPLVILETAQPAKFGDFVEKALDKKPWIPDAFRDMSEKPKRFVTLPAKVDAVKKHIVSVLGN